MNCEIGTECHPALAAVIWLDRFFIHKQCSSAMFGLATPLVPALLINMSCPVIRLEYIQPHPSPAEFATTYLIDYTDDSRSVAKTRLGHNYSTKLNASSVSL